MTRKTRQLVLASIAMVLAAVLVLFFANRRVAKDPIPPQDDVVPMAAWLARHPTDWLTASQLSDAALDSNLPRREELWRASYALARHIAPNLQNPPAAFVRGGLFHWYELGDADRKAVLEAAAPLLRDPLIFSEMHQALWQLTRDFDYLFRNAPQSLGALENLRIMAASNGLFAEYRQTREAVARERLATFERTHASLPPHELPSLLPRRLSTDDEALIVRILQDLHRRSYEPARFGDPTTVMIDYAIAHHLQPLEALAPFVDAVKVIPDATRARLAGALGRHDDAALIEMSSVIQPEPAPSSRPEWRGTCGANEVCDTARTLLHWKGGMLEIAADTVQSDQIPPYVEIYADDTRVAEGEIAQPRHFAFSLEPGPHRLEVRLVNPRIANNVQRRVRLS
jgi:hypothetical protein